MAIAALSAGLLAVGLVPTASAVTPPTPTATQAASTPVAAAATATGDRSVSFAGVTVRVPSDWPVLDVDGVPGCVRYDRNAVYLGEPSEVTCPAHVVGRTATVQILRASGGSATKPTVSTDGAGDLQITDGVHPRVIVTADASDPALASTIATGASIDGVAVGTTAVTNARAGVAAPDGTITDSAPESPTGSAPNVTTQAVPNATPLAVPPPPTLSGTAFDTCAAPSLTQLNAWQASRYGAVGVYIGGVNRGCAQPNLTPSWVTSANASGWHLLPIYVGLQAPCSPFTDKISTNLTTAANQGTAAATDAAQQMTTLGLSGGGNPVYLDMESWDNTNASCTAAVMAFTNAWTVALQNAEYTAGFYSSASTGITALVAWIKAHSTFHAPGAVWFARWDNKAVTTDPAIPSTLWPNHQRVKQYEAPHNETYGGQTINIDSDVLDGPVTPAAFSLSTAPVPAAVPGRAYSVQLYARTGTAPFTFKITAGALPKGLTLSSSGKISGTTTVVTAGTSVTITATDKTGATAQRSVKVVVTYTDVPTGSQFFADIAWLTNAGISNGNGNGTFGPTAPVLREQMAAFLYRYAHNGADAGACTGPSPFSDVLATSIFCGDIAWLKAQGISNGNGNGTFGPTAPVLREQMAAFLYRLTHAGTDAGACTGPSPFRDVPQDSIFCGDIAWLASTGITNGSGNGDFSPAQAVLRQEMAAFLHRLSQLPA